MVFTDQRWKNSAKMVTRFISEILYGATFRKVVFGYSTMVVARKQLLSLRREETS